MNQRELGELRRRFRPEKSAISRVYGCYVNSSREIIAYIDQSLGLMPQEEAEKYLGLLKKALSGTLGRKQALICPANLGRSIDALADKGAERPSTRALKAHEFGCLNVRAL